MPLPPLSVEEKVGQLFWIGFQGTSLKAPLESLLQHVRPAAVILFSRNIQSVPQVCTLIDDVNRVLRVPPFVALDQEGGRVNRLKPILGPIPASLDLARRKGAEKAVRSQATAMAAALKALGFNVNLAPVLDLSGPDAENGIGDRAFGSNPETVCRLARIFLEAHRKAGVIPVGKHFPGLGSARADTHVALPVISKSRSRLIEEDLLPYRRLGRLLPIVMAGHASYPALQGGISGPATLSKAVIQGLLRRLLRYRGVVVTDDLEMGAVEQRMGAGAHALAALAAGNDGLMFCGSEDKIRQAYDEVLSAVRRGDVSGRRLSRSLGRIAALKTSRLAGPRAARSPVAILERSRLTLASLGAGDVSGFDPTARA